MMVRNIQRPHCTDSNISIMSKGRNHGANNSVDLDILVVGLKTSRPPEKEPNNATIRKSELAGVKLRPDLDNQQPSFTLVHYNKPRYVPTPQGLHPQFLQQLNITDDARQRPFTIYSDSESNHSLQEENHHFFNFDPKTPHDADIMRKVNSVPSLRSLNELRRYKFGLPPERKFRMMLSKADGDNALTAKLAKEYYIEMDKEKRSLPFYEGISIVPQKQDLVPRPSSPSAQLLRTGTETRRSSSRARNHDGLVIRPNTKYDSGVKLAPLDLDVLDMSNPNTRPASGIGHQSISGSSQHSQNTPIYTPATFRIPKAVSEDNKTPYDSYAAQDPMIGSLHLLSSAEEATANSPSAGGYVASRSYITAGGTIQEHLGALGGEVFQESAAELSARMRLMHESDSFHEGRKEQFLHDSLILDEHGSVSTNTDLSSHIRVQDHPGRTRVPKKYSGMVEQLDEARGTTPGDMSRSASRQQKLRSRGGEEGVQEIEDGEYYEALARTGTSRNNKLQCTNCYIQAVLWCTQCVQAFCLVCWNNTPHHTLYNMVPAFPNKQVKKYQRQFCQVVSEASPAYKAPAKTVTLGLTEELRQRSRPPSPMVPQMAVSNSVPYMATVPAATDKSYASKVMFATMKTDKTNHRSHSGPASPQSNPGAAIIERKLQQYETVPRVFDGNQLPAKIPLIDVPTVQYQDYTIPGVYLTGKGNIMELMNDDCSESLASGVELRSPRGSNNNNVFSRPTTPGGTLQKVKPSTARPSSAVNLASPNKRDISSSGNAEFRAEIHSAIHYVTPKSQQSLMPLRNPIVTPQVDNSGPILVPSGFDNSSPHKELVKKLTRENFRSLKKKGDTRLFSPSFNLSSGGGGGGGGIHASASGSNIAATISRPSTVAVPLIGITKDIVFPTAAEAAAEAYAGEDRDRGRARKKSASKSKNEMKLRNSFGNAATEDVGVGGDDAVEWNNSGKEGEMMVFKDEGIDEDWKEGEFKISPQTNITPASTRKQSAVHATKVPTSMEMKPPQISIYGGIPVYTRDYKKEEREAAAASGDRKTKSSKSYEQ